MWEYNDEAALRYACANINATYGWYGLASHGAFALVRLENKYIYKTSHIQAKVGLTWP